MSRYPRAETARERGRDTERKLRRISKRSPCNRPPTTPVGLVGAFDRSEGARGGHRLRLSLRWDEVTEDTSGFRTLIKSYKVEIEYTANGTDWFQHGRFTVPAKDDGDPNEKVHYVVKGMLGRLQYRFRVKAVLFDRCDSPWSTWESLGAANDETPPAPSNVTIHANSVDRVVVDWDDTPDPNDDERRRDDQGYFGVELSKVANFSVIFRRDRRVERTRAAFKIPPADAGSIFYARVWSVNDAGDKAYKSLKIPATEAGNSDPEAAPDFVLIADVGSAFEPGDIKPWPGPLKPGWSKCSGGAPTQPSGAPWARCDGCLYATANYPAVFAEIGYLYGGSGANFGVPNLKGRRMVGAADPGDEPVSMTPGDVGGDNVEDTDDKDHKHIHKHPHKHGHKHQHNHGGHGHNHGHGGHGHSHNHGGHGHNHNHASHGHGHQHDTAGTHSHNAGTLSMGGPGATTGKATGTQSAAGPTHTHNPITGDTGSTGSSHQHTTDSTGTTPNSDASSATPGTDFTNSTIGTDATSATPSTDVTLDDETNDLTGGDDTDVAGRHLHKKRREKWGAHNFVIRMT